MPIIAIITKNKCVFEMEEYVAPLLYKIHTREEKILLKNKLNDYIWSIIEKYITFVDVNDTNNFFETMYAATTIDFPDKNHYDFIFNTEGSYSTPKKFIELINMRPTWKEYEDSTKNINIMNDIGCLLSLCHTVIENTCFVVANEYDLSAHRYVKMVSILKDDIIRVIRRRYFHSAILIKENSIVKYYFQNSEYLISTIFGSSDTDKTIEMLPFAHFNYNLIFNFKKHATQYVNKIATRINGCHRIYGDVLVFHEIDKGVFANLSAREFKRLNVLSYGCLADRKFNNNEVHQVPTVSVDEAGKEITETVPFWSKYIIIENRISLWQKNKYKCTYCDSICTMTCDRCYRARYCSLDCKNKFITQHNSECIV